MLHPLNREYFLFLQLIQESRVSYSSQTESLNNPQAQCLRLSSPMLLSRLSGRKVCERVKTKGSVWKGKHFQVRFIIGAPKALPPSAMPKIFLGLVTSAKLEPSAAKRNRMRRRCREAIRVTLLPTSLPVTAQLIVLPRSSTLTAPFGELLADAEKLLHFLSSPPREYTRPFKEIRI